MNRLLLLFCFISSFAAPLTAQNYENCAQVIGTTGKFAKRGGKTFFYTVGEPVILTLKGQSHVLTQGFHQPDLCISVATNDLDIAAWQIEVFPNPVSDMLNIRYDAEQGEGLECSVFNLFGQMIVGHQALTRPSDSFLSTSDWQPGVYILRFRDPVTDRSAPVRIIKI